MGVPPGNRPAVPRDWFRGVPERYVAGAYTRGRQEGRPYPWSQQVIHEISGLPKPPIQRFVPVPGIFRALSSFESLFARFPDRSP
jgi:hypothetical protein